MKIIELKYKIEKKFKKIKLYNNVYGFQIQPDTLFSKGISNKQIDEVAASFGFALPWKYREMLLTFSGLDRPLISIDPTNTETVSYKTDSFFYRYPEDFEKIEYLINEIKEFESEVKDVLFNTGFDVSTIVGYVPIYMHRVLVVFEDRYLSPVISIMGADVILYGTDLVDYLKNELLE